MRADEDEDVAAAVREAVATINRGRQRGRVSNSCRIRGPIDCLQASPGFAVVQPSFASASGIEST